MLAANRDSNGPEPSTSQIREYKFLEIQTATKNFSRSFEIGSGGFGKVYIGNIINGSSRVYVAIKRFDPKSKQGQTEFLAEILTLGKLRNHPNIITLIGFCEDGEEKILVYKYANNGTVHDHLHKHRTLLSSFMRLNICVSVAHGLHYLHDDNGFDFGVIHGDLNSSNVLLHGCTAIISDFGLSKECPKNKEYTFVRTDHIKGTLGHLDPNYCRTGQLRRKTDVYAFGVFMLEVLCRKPALGEALYGEGMNLVKWARNFIKKGNLEHIIDPDIWGEMSMECWKKLISIVESCLYEELKSRPTMAKVVARLEHVKTKLHSSSQPAIGRKIFGRMVSVLPFSNGGTSSISNPSLEEFRFDYLRKATKNFNQDLLLGEGIFGKVFSGRVDKKTSAPAEQGVIDVAVKNLKQNSSSQGVVHSHWLAEVNFFGNMGHRNIISLLGYCKDKSKHLLVYELMSNKSFYDLLFPNAPDTSQPFTLKDRLTAMTGAARGLEYLHSAKFIHFNLRSRNILVPKDFDAKLGGLSLVKFCPEGRESHGTTTLSEPMACEDPEYVRTGVVTMESDIYCFGILLLEGLTGRHASSFTNVIEDMNTGRINVKDMMDPRLEDNYLEDASKCFTLALRCVADKPADRPSIEEVLLSLRRV